MKQNTYTFSPQMDSEVEDGDNGLRPDKTKPKKKKLKFQARNTERNMETTEYVMVFKKAE